ncbi:MAG TPA: riboflavin synthase [Saprospiraceae bacterium]|nr:riboflavin synthase [Saprospiraceae bacterium]
MFSGIIKSTGIVRSIQATGSTKRITIASPLADELTIDQSIAHDGICLTVVAINNGTYEVEVVQETLSKTTFASMKEGGVVNLEKSITPTTLLDGHLVQGHVDTTIKCMRIEDLIGSWKIQFNLPKEYASLVIPHGSICLNGVSLTVANLYPDSFDVAIIPYTFEHTNFKHLLEGNDVNVEFDLIGKYLLRQAALRNS